MQIKFDMPKYVCISVTLIAFLFLILNTSTKSVPNYESFYVSMPNYLPDIVMRIFYIPEHSKKIFFVPPVNGFITSMYGIRLDPFYGITRHHNGIDIAFDGDATVRAPAEGTVKFSGVLGSCGVAVVLDHGMGLSTRCCHLSRSFVMKGEIVKRGDAIGDMGSTGRSTGRHLHFEVRFNGIPVNPEDFLWF